MWHIHPLYSDQDELKIGVALKSAIEMNIHVLCSSVVTCIWAEAFSPSQIKQMVI